jgi:hypothetical protein
MSKLYATIDGAAKNQATMRGHSEIVTHAASWAGAIRVRVSIDKDGVERFEIEMTPWKGAGDSRVIAAGVMGDARSVVQYS